MPLFIFAMLLKAVFEGFHAYVRKRREVTPQPLCADCFYAHVQYTANARRAICCTFGGAVRPMKLDVLYCTDYCARKLPLRAGVIGFVHEIAPAE
jgi:hypothetical protein